MNWIKVLYPEQRKVFVDGAELGNTNKKQFVGEDGTYTFDLGTPVDYKPRSIRRAVSGTSRDRPLVLRFQRRARGS